MATTPITNIYHPDNSTLAQDVPTLGAMADSIETAMLNLPRKFANFTALEAWTPANGALAFVQADGRTYQRVSGAWRIVQARHISEAPSTGRAYFGTGEGATGAGTTYLGLSPATETGRTIAAWITVDGTEVFTVYKDRTLQSRGDMQVNGRILNAHSPFAMDSGRTTLSGAAGATRSATITFPVGRFTKTPNVSTGMQSTAPGNGNESVFGISSTGFTLHLYYANASNITVYWTAVQMGA